MLTTFSIDGGPTADDVALAIVMAARFYGEDPIGIARGHGSRGTREAAFCALELCFPWAKKASLVRMVTGGKTFLTNFRKGWTRDARQAGYKLQLQIADAIHAQRNGRSLVVVADEPPVSVVTKQAACVLTTRRKPASDYEIVTAGLMGDPPPCRSALHQRQ